MQPAALKGFRLSIQQARLWAVQGKSLAYRILCRVRIEGRLDLEIFQQALQKLVARHAILRTQLYCMPGMDMPMQVVANEDTIACPLVSLQNMELSQQENQVDRYAKNALETPFDLEQGPLLRCVLLRLSASSHILLISLPAFCADAATPKHLIAELAQVYDLCLEGKDLADDPLQYADVSAWQDELLEEEDAGEQHLFWRRIDLSSLDTMHLPFEMRTRRDRSSKQSDLFFTPQVVEVPGVANWPAQLQALLQRADVSLEAFLLTCWQVIIWRLTGQTPVLVGVECDGRYHEELSGAPGPYSRVVPISISLAEKLPFERVLLLVHSFVEEAKRRQIYFSWPSLFSRAEGEPDTSFFPISFAYNEWPASIHARDLIFCMEQSTSCPEPFALKLHAWRVGQELHLQLHFDPRRLSFSSMQRLAKSLYTLVQGTFIQPQACVDALPVLPLEDQQHLRNCFTVPSIPTSFQTLSQAFEVQAERHPRQVAVVCEGEQLTYYQLNIYANRLAHTLQRLGVGANVLVGLYVERSVHMLVGMLAILKAGGAYVPLDPDQPAARLSYQLHDLQTPILLTQDHLRARLPAWNGQVLCLDKPGSWGNHELEHNLPPQSGAQDLAYVIYTSGSTGVPKGVMIRQHSVMNYTAALCELLATQPGLQFATVSTLAADLGNTSIFCSLASGGCLHILNYATVTLGEAFADYTAQHPIDVLKIVPSHLSALLASCGGRSILPRKYLVLGGEALSYELLRQLEAQPGTCCLLNHYGPTETTVGALVNVLGELGTGTRIYDENKNEAATVPIGRPIAGMEAYILDQFRQMVPVGVTGELYLGGVGLAVGYWQQPGQTQERFVEHPWSDEPGARLYRTGDLARYCDDGTIEFVGRVDFQVKLRGYRIEPGEIEAVLRSHPTVRENVVVLREDTPGDRRLVAYIVAQPPVPDEEELRHLVGEQLPGYMVPSSFVFLRVLPLNANGKVDRHMLPPPATIEDQKATTYQAPRTPVEEIVVGIWKSVLQVKQIGIYDNFSSLGGHSLLATQIISRICSALEINVPLRYLFEFPTVAGLSERIEQIQRSGGDVKSLPLVPVPRTGKLPLSFAQQRLWFLDQLDSEHAAYLIPSVRRFQGALDVAALERSLAELVRRHEVLRTTFDGRAGQPVQIIHTANMFRLPVVDLRGLVQEEERASEARQLAGQEARRPCNLTEGPLLRTHLLRLHNEEHVLLLTMHHIISDAWSNDVFYRELSALYQAFVAGHPSPLLPLPIQYADFALWQRQYLQGEILEAQLAYWRQQLAGVPPLELPTDHPRPPVQTYRGAFQFVSLPAALQEAVTLLSQQEGVTLFMLLLAAFQVLLARYSAQDDISVGTAIANRTRPELEGLIGFFVNTLVLRSDLSGNPSFLDLLPRVREVALSAYTHQDVPFEQLVEVLQPQRDLSRSPLFQVMFGVHQAPEAAPGPAGLRVSGLSIEHSTTKFDLTFNVISSAQGLRCGVEYSTDLFEARTIERLLAHWQTLLEGIVAQPHGRLADLPLLTAAERDELLYGWNSPQATAPQETWLRLFDRQVARRPDALAVVSAETCLSYGCLERHANQLAHLLHAQGVGPEVLVGVCVERSAALLLGLLATLKAGGGYLPLEPSYPAERLEHMLQQTQAPLLLTRQGWPALSQARLSSRVLALGQLWPNLLAQPAEAPPSGLQPDNVAYVIYTSGSTGQPKGVLVPHRGLAPLTQAQVALFGVQPASHVLQFASLSFDASLAEILVCWGAGACLYLPAPEQVLVGEALVRVLEQWAITVLTVPPSVWAQVPPAPLAALCTLVVAGEDCWAELVQRWAPGRRMCNAYGPSETTVCATVGACQPEAERKPSIGKRLEHVRCYVLDEQGQPVPRGVIGELYLGGEGVARGYVQQAAETAERFVPDGFGTEAGGRLYRTGDRVRSLGEGELEYVGRADGQVKVRGYRVELGEIEAVVQGCEGVQQSVVLWREQEQGEGRLVAYVVGEAGAEAVTARQVRGYVQERLPEYLQPSQVVVLEALPRLPNGKVDRRALPSSETLSPKPDVLIVGARTPLEEVLAEIWCEILEDEQIGIHDNFFALGGHSLLATRLMARVQAVLQVDLPVTSLFKAPTIAKLAQEVEQALRDRSSIEAPPLVPVDRAQDLPLSFAQQRLWFLDQLEPQSTAYLISNAFRLQGALDALALERSLHELICRHETLRTTFQLRDGQPVQVISPARVFYLPVVDLQGLAQQEREREARRLARQEAQHPCDLTQGPLLRTHLLQLHEDAHVLLLTMHHIISDEWSNEVFVRELTGLYRSFVAGQPSPLPPLPIQYADFALWQRHWLQGEVLEKQLAYWEHQLAGIPPLELSTDYPRPPVQTYRGARQSIQLPLSLHEQLIALSQQEGVTLFMLLLAAFQVLLVRYTGQSDISVGSPIANRTRPELEGLIGFFVNTLVLRTDLSGNPPFLEVLNRVHKVALDAYTHQDVPFEQLVEVLQPERDLSRSPLFQVMFMVQHMVEPTGGQEGLTSSKLGVERTTTKFDLTLSIVTGVYGLHCAVEYNADLFEISTISRLLKHWQVLLEGIVAHPGQRLAELPLLADGEQRLLLEKWNDTRTEFSKKLCIHELFETQVRRTPYAPALSFEDVHFSYAELNQRANQVAHLLRRADVGPDILVGICLERSLDLLVAIVGILKAGGAYVPLDPTYPKERLTYILLDAHISVLMTQKRLMGVLPDLGQQNICLDSEWEAIATEDTTNPVNMTIAEHTAYVIYTSGSTGIPKGVMISHCNVTNFFAGMDSRIGSELPGVWLATTSISFDISVLELLWTLTRGFHVIIQEKVEEVESTLEPSKFLAGTELHDAKKTMPGRDYSLPAQMRRYAVTHLQCTPSLARMLLLLPETADALKGLQKMLLGGEALPLSLVKHLKSVTRAELHNMYGPTETTIWSTTSCLKDVEDVVSIGRPIANTQVYLLDTHLQPVPIGAIGELYIGGEGLARGYLHQPALTAEKFIPNPWGDEAGARLYKTGDLARYHQDGSIEYLGRLDQQVKVRGYRIELGEVEAALGQHPALLEAAVVVHKDSLGESRLAAYIVAKKDAAPSIEELRSYLKKKLPEPMLPSHFVFMDALLLTANGKVDRRALPALELYQDEEGKKLSNPRTPFEELLAEVWRRVLGRKQMGIHDDFFVLGGHSLLAMRLISQLRSMLQVEIPLRSLFEAPTIAGLAQQVELILRRGKGKGIEAPSLVPVARTHGLPLSFAQQRLWFLDQLEPGSTAYLMPGAHLLRGALDTAALERCLEELVRRHETLRTTFELQADRPVQVVHPAGSFNLPLIDLRMLGQEERVAEARHLAEHEARCPYDLTRGSLLRTYLLRLDGQEHVLLITMHHIISDGWSNEVFLRELTMLYRAFAAGQPSPLSPLPVQYADFAVWQRQWLQGEVLEAQLAYWRQQLAGVPPLELPVDHPRPPRQTFRGAYRSFLLPSSLYEGLIALSHREGATLFMLLLAAFQVLLARYTGQDDISVGTPIANRTRSELEGLIGFFVNTLVLRTDLSGNPSFLHVLRRVREVALEAYSYQDVPFEQLVEMLQPERDLSRNPLFQVMFILQNIPPARLEASDLQVSPLEVKNTTAKFDLTLSLGETSQGLRGQLEYNVDLFNTNTIDWMVGHWQNLLEGIVANPEQKLSALPLLTESERQQFLSEWNNTEKDYPGNTFLHRLIEAQVERTPDAIAVGCDDEYVTYQQLNKQANKIAQSLVEHGVGPEIPVALLVERSIFFLTAILAIFKADGLYLPLDPLYPATRLGQMINQSHCRFVLTTGVYMPVLSQALEAISIETCPQALQLETLLEREQLTTNLPVRCQLDNLAYVIYTSGSTGTPKGVMVEHRGMLNHMYAKIADVQLSHADIVAQIGPPCFDISIWQCFAALFLGGRVHIFGDEIAFNPVRLLEQIEEKAISILQLVPSMLREIIHKIASADAGCPDLFALRWLVPTGDALPADLCRRWLNLYPQIPLLNTYGSTECSDDQCHYPITSVHSADEWTKIMTIGSPIPNMQAYVLDHALELVPVGIVGELYIGGVGVGRGYLDDPGRTAAAFLPDPFGSKAGKRLYKTGDQARYLANGTIEFLGRIDHLVKIRGYRIELGEIEAVLEQHPQVRTGVVIARTSASGAQQLIAYVVREELEVALSSRTLHTYLQGKLPDYMIPSHFVALEALPLNANGKVDRRALPLPDQAALEPEVSFVAPRTPAEEVVAKIWVDILGVQQVGLFDDFFAIGGHSLLATQVISRLNSAFQIELPLRSLFEARTVDALICEIVRIHGEREIIEEIAQVLKEIECLTEDEVEQQLSS